MGGGWYPAKKPWNYVLVIAFWLLFAVNQTTIISQKEIQLSTIELKGTWTPK